MLRRQIGKYPADEGWNLADARLMKTVIGNTPLFPVGGLRKLATMQKLVEDGEVDFISLGRPLIREPNLVNKFKTGQTEVAACASCNKCTGQIMLHKPLRCMQLSGEPNQD
jgi:2,4-dienoyl-CoA reductase-like NADH-dependent reductase (Old Yellow Enzyme family)